MTGLACGSGAVGARGWIVAERAVGGSARGDYGENAAGIMWCPVCREDALPHAETGRRMFCDTLLIDVRVRAVWLAEQRRRVRR